MKSQQYAMITIYLHYHLVPLLLTRISFNPSIDRYSIYINFDLILDNGRHYLYMTEVNSFQQKGPLLAG